MAGTSVTDHQQDNGEEGKRTLEQRIKDLEIQNGELLRRLKAVENRTEQVDNRTFMFQKVGLN